MEEERKVTYTRKDRFTDLLISLPMLVPLGAYGVHLAWHSFSVLAGIPCL